LAIEIANGSALVFLKESAIAWFLVQLVISIANETLSESSNESLDETIFFLIGDLEISIVIVFFLLTFLVYASLSANVFAFLCATLNAIEFVFFVVDYRASRIYFDGVGDDPDFPICFVVCLIPVADLLISWMLEIFCLPLQTAHQ